MEMQSTERPNYNSNYQKMDGEDSTQSWYLLSIISWILFVISMWVSYNYGYYFWTPYTIFFGGDSIYYFPIELGSVTINMPWLNRYFFLISVIGFSVYLIFTTCKKNQSLYDGMLGTLSRFHFIPLLCISALYNIAVSAYYFLTNDSEIIELLKSYRTLITFDLISL